MVTKPIYGIGNPTNDYGLGFYLTKNKEIARLWASKSNKGGYLIEYDVNLSGLNIRHLDTLREEDVLAWITLLVSHRFSRELRVSFQQRIDWLEETFPIDISSYDVVIGYRADDAYFDYSYDFVSDRLSLERLEDAMHLGKLGMQTVLISQKAFSRIRYVRHEEVEHNDEYASFRARTRQEYLRLRKTDSDDNTFLRDIIRRRKKQ